MVNTGKLDGKVAIITGSSRGIGQRTARLFAAEGAKVVCVARTLKEGDHFLEGSLETTVLEIQNAGGVALAVQADVSKEESCAELVEAARKAFGPVDILANNAAVAYYIPFNDLTLKRWTTSFAVNVHGPFMLIKQVLPDMVKRHRGAIINITSRSSVGPGRGPYKSPSIGDIAYGATKAAIERFTQGLAAELYEQGITVVSLSPSQTVATPGTIYNKLLTGYDDQRGEPVEMMPKAMLLLATAPLDKVTGRVVYSQAILKEFGWIKEGRGSGIEEGYPMSGYSKQ